MDPADCFDNVKSDMYRPNDVLIEGHRLSNLFNTQDEDWHNQNIRPIRGLWSMTKVLEYEPFIDETINKLVEKIALNFVDGDCAGKICPADEWIGFCKSQSLPSHLRTTVD
jgi:hypothetical protein